MLNECSVFQTAHYNTHRSVGDGAGAGEGERERVNEKWQTIKCTMIYQLNAIQ